ncbi:MAG: helix-turn-helix domain-containing protein [Sphingomonas sp.]|nr:helix-turn-helix domain-containing protein [Sphingomonas sp.]
MLPDIMERFDTISVPPERRVDYWCELVSRMTSPVSFMPESDSDVQCTLMRGVYERFTFSHAVTSEIKVFRSKEHARQARGFNYLYLQLEGTGELVCQGQSVKTLKNSLILFDESTPYRFKALSPIRTMAIGIPSSLVAARLPGYRDIVMRPLDTNTGIIQILQSSLRAMNALFVEQDVRNFPHAVFMSLIELLAASVDEVTDGQTDSSTIARWAGKIRAYVEAHLDDPDLSPASISRDLGISARYLRLIFADSNKDPGQGETLRRYILRRRLEECATRLADEKFRCGSITELAHSWGFSDSSYFARRFIEQFGVTPRAFRVAKQARQEEAAEMPSRH